MSKRELMTKNKPKLSPVLKGITVGPVEAGKIKIGGKGAERESRSGTKYNMAEKYDGFVITKLSKKGANFEVDYETMRALGSYDEKSKSFKPLKSIPIELNDDDVIKFYTSGMACYQGKKCVCRGDREFGIQSDGKVVECPCHKSEKKDSKSSALCKPNGKFSCIIKGVTPIGKVHVFRTTGYASIISLYSGLRDIYKETGGRFRGITFYLTYTKKTITDQFGQVQTIPVVGIECRMDRKEMREAIKENAILEAKFMANMQKLEGYGIGATEEELIGIEEIEEFYPDQQIQDKNEDLQQIAYNEEEVREPENQADPAEEKTEPTREFYIEELKKMDYPDSFFKGKKVQTLADIYNTGVMYEARPSEEVDVTEYDLMGDLEINDNDDINIDDILG